MFYNGLLAKMIRKRVASPYFTVHVFAHSMGNVVVSEALRAYPSGQGFLMQDYIASQAAEVADSYNPQAPEMVNPLEASAILSKPNQLFGEAWGQVNVFSELPPDIFTTALVTSDLYASTGAHYYNGLAGKVGNFVNFFNERDDALVKWKFAQVTKPDIGWDYTITADGAGHYWDVNLTTASAELTYPKDRINILSRITPARSTALGAYIGSGGEVKPEGYNMKPDFKKVHSAQFLSDYEKRKGYWLQLISSMRLN